MFRGHNFKMLVEFQGMNQNFFNVNQQSLKSTLYIDLQQKDTR